MCCFCCSGTWQLDYTLAEEVLQQLVALFHLRSVAMLNPIPFWKALSLSHCLLVVLAGSGQFKLMTEVGSGITCSTDNNSVAKDSLHHFQVLSYVPRHGERGERAPGIHTVCACALL